MTAIELLAGEHQKGESAKAIIACNDWLRLGPGRTLPALLGKYAKTDSNPPTTSLHTLKDWSNQFNWVERAVAFDAAWEVRKNAERQAMMNYGLALDFERVRRLKDLADLLERQIYERDEEGNLTNLWVADVKGIGKGTDFERVDIVRFNPALVEQFRNTLDDLAKETGGRIQKQNIHVDDWRSQAIEDIKSKRISFDALAEAFDRDLATQLFAAAGEPVPPE